MREIDPLVWFGKRRCDTIPRHFVKTTTPVTDEAKSWVTATLKGRYAITTVMEEGETLTFIELSDKVVFYFEDPAEAMIYELRWSGSK